MFFKNNLSYHNCKNIFTFSIIYAIISYNSFDEKIEKKINIQLRQVLLYKCDLIKLKMIIRTIWVVCNSCYFYVFCGYLYLNKLGNLYWFLQCYKWVALN